MRQTVFCILFAAVAGTASAQHDHAAGGPSGAMPTSPGNAAFGTIKEIVKMLDADPATDWSKVNIEALRQHLVDMDLVLMTSTVKQRNVTGGVELTVTGTGPSVGAIRRMSINHTRMLDGPQYRASASEIPNGAKLVIAAQNANDTAAVARIRGLGFAGLFTEGDHHAMHHLALARGEAVHSP
jgi:hypothetical protein